MRTALRRSDNSYLHKTGAETLLRHLLPLVQIPPREILQQKLQNLQQ